MNPPIPSLDVYRERSKGELAILHKSAYFKNQIYLGNVAWGRIQRLTPSEFEASGLEIVRASLSEFSRRVEDNGAEFEMLGKQSRREFFRDHQCVGISLRENSDLWLDPIQHKVMGVSGFGRAEERSVITPSHGPQDFWGVLTKCFELAD